MEATRPFDFRLAVGGREHAIRKLDSMLRSMAAYDQEPDVEVLSELLLVIQGRRVGAG